MIDPVIFAANMTAFGDRVKHHLGEQAQAMYYETLSAELDTEGFQRGIAAMFRDHKFNTWPAPHEIIDRGRPSRALTAAAAWSHLEDALKMCVPYQPLIVQLRMGGVSEDTIATFMAVGGLARWRRANDFRAEDMRTEFLDRYQDVVRLEPVQREAITGPPVRPALTNGAVSIGRLMPGPYSPGDPER